MPCFFLLDEGKQLIHLDNVHLLRLRRWGQLISVRFHPVGYTLMIDTKVTPNATQVHPVNIHSNCLLSDFIGITTDGWFWGVSNLASVALVTLATGLIATGFDLVL